MTKIESFGISSFCIVQSRCLLIHFIVQLFLIILFTEAIVTVLLINHIIN